MLISEAITAQSCTFLGVCFKEQFDDKSKYCSFENGTDPIIWEKPDDNSADYDKAVDYLKEYCNYFLDEHNGKLIFF